MRETRAAELLIPAKCVSESRSYHGYVLRLGRDQAYFTTLEPGFVAEGPVVLKLQLPWQLGSIEVDAWASRPASLVPVQLPGVTLSFEELSTRDRSRVERFLMRFHQLVAEILR